MTVGTPTGQYGSTPLPTAARTAAEAMQPSADLLTAEQAIRYLRLDEIGLKNPHLALARYRYRGLLHGTRFAGRVWYLRSELDAFLRRCTEDGDGPPA